MKPEHKGVLLAVALALIIGAIAWLETQKPSTETGALDGPVTEIATEMPPGAKDQRFPKAKELADPQGFLNGDSFQLKNYIGQKVILVDFWTYSCINCQRTLPYLTAWWDKYEDQGLLIVGVHTPEFDFEKKEENVQAATDKYGIKYPVVLDNNYATWRAYMNRYWPHKYLIDIDGYIVYDHIGEGAYDETEREIQRLLKERADRLSEDKSAVSGGTVQPTGTETASGGLSQTPEIYFGSRRNERLANGPSYSAGRRQFTLPAGTDANYFYLGGDWTIEDDYAENEARGDKIILHYRAQKVFMVASADEPVRLKLTLDGQPLGSLAGASVNGDGIVTVEAADLYRLIEDSQFGEHVLEIEMLDTGLQAFTFTFG